MKSTDPLLRQKAYLKISVLSQSGISVFFLSKKNYSENLQRERSRKIYELLLHDAQNPFAFQNAGNIPDRPLKKMKSGLFIGKMNGIPSALSFFQMVFRSSSSF